MWLTASALLRAEVELITAKLPSQSETTGGHQDHPLKQRCTGKRIRIAAAAAGALVIACAGTAIAQQWTPSAPIAPPPAAAVPQVQPPDARPLPRRAALRFLTDNDYPPFNYVDDDGSLTGFNVDVARAICLELGATCDIQSRPWGDLLQAARRGEADAVIASHAMSARNVQGLDISDRYYHTPARFVGRRGGPPFEVTPTGLDRKKIAVAKGSAHEAYLRTFFALSTIQVYDNTDLARDAVVTGTADLLFEDGINLVFWLNGTTSKACCEFKGGPFTEPRFFGDGVGILLNRDDPALRPAINAALKRIRENGRYEELVLRYFPLRAY
jgi:polar amino acid transport system substrate-binding protein